MSVSSQLHTRIGGVLGALRFAWIPALCAGVIVLGSEQAAGRLIAAAVAFAAFCLGVTVHASEIFLGRSARQRPEGPPPRYNSTGEWLAARPR